MIRCLIVALVLAGLMLPVQSVVAQQDESGISWSGTSRVPARTLEGVVLEASTGRLLEEALVQIRGSSFATVTDSMGRFRLQTLPAGSYRLRVTKIGYLPANDSIEVEARRGIAVRATLAEDTIRNCGLIVCARGCGDVQVYVRDVLTGASPRGPVVLRVQRDSIVDSSTVEPGDVRASVLLLTAGRGGGPFDVEVAAPGYVTWRRSGVEVERDECGIHGTPPLEVWLLPED